ncbi:MAG: butyryl-CoA dehydrogenase [Oceanospirillaceae bacterium]|nr:butyryl-CoA dehydrogenase [Oceanospirillaceae bacterium]MBT13669.1 butyryl-CoA dehydrogenase [Oceanospirillaceae bacterium]|tara:strand:- start:8133 stop:9449 length:1317 start_codon:yes stop_codon:yes gene_type:complete
MAKDIQAKDMQGLGLGLATRFSGSRLAIKTGLRVPAEKLAYLSVKTGFRLAGRRGKQRPAAADSSVDGERLPNSREQNLFDLTLTEEQQIISASMRSCAQKLLRPNADFADADTAPPAEFFHHIHELGLSHLAIPEALGGAASGYQPTTSCLIAEALAHGDFSLACAALSPVAVANALSRWGTSRQQQLLQQWLQDEPLQAAIAAEERTLNNAAALQTHAIRNTRGYRLNGSKTLVPLGGEASLYLVTAMLDDAPRVFIVPAGRRGLSFHKQPAMGLRAAATGELRLNQVQLDQDALLGSDDFDYQTFTDLSLLHWCAMAVGTCQAALDYLIPYCNERKAFGEPITHRQSVAFMLADMATELEGMRLLTWRAAALAEQGKDFHREAVLAHTLCTENAMKTGTDAVQLLGGHGFTQEHPAERWYRDLRLLGCMRNGMHL